MLTEQQLEHAKMLLKSGWTYQQVADMYGVTRQAIHNHIPHQSAKAGYRGDYIYPNLKKFMKENKVGLPELSKVCGVQKVTLTAYFHGRRAMNKDVIDALLKYTGMKYEELFMENEKGKGE